MRVVFLGTPEFAVPTLQALLEAKKVEVVGVFTQPDRKAGRGQQLKPPPVKVVAQENRIPVYQFESVRRNPEAVRTLEELNPDVCVVVAFGQILTPEFFELPPKGTLNVHASLLPAYRGAGPVAHAILNGDSETGVTIMKIDAGMDTGDMLSRRTVKIPPAINAGELAEVLSETGAKLLVETLDGYMEGTILPVKQDSEKATYAPRLKKEDGRIDWERRAVTLHNQVRGLNPWPGAYFSWREMEIKLWRTSVGPSRIGKSGCSPGTVKQVSKKGIVVECGNCSELILQELQLPNRKKVSALEFINGTAVAPGDCFS